jgi:hypothetical protein
MKFPTLKDAMSVLRRVFSPNYSIYNRDFFLKHTFKKPHKGKG